MIPSPKKRLAFFFKRLHIDKLVLLLALLSATLALDAQTQPKREFRGAWMQAVNGQFRGKSTQSVQKMLLDQLDVLQKTGINAIIFQVRVEADALYDSPYEPWSRYLSGTQGASPSPAWDPLAFMVEECHKRSMELHAWINPYRAKTTLKNATAQGSVLLEHPEWFKTYADQLFFDPAFQECRDHIVKVASDIVSRYDVDGFHMDDYFYPYPSGSLEFPDQTEYEKWGSGFATIGDWRRHNVDLLIEQLSNAIRSLKPWVKFGISPFGIYRNQSSDPDGSKTNGLQNYDQLYADVLKWTSEGWVDYLVPQIYWQVGHPVADFQELNAWWARHNNGRRMYVGESITNTIANPDPSNPSSHQMPLKMNMMRSTEGIDGTCFWYAAALYENQGNYREALEQMYYPYMALQPTYPFLDDKAPKKPAKLKAVWTSDGYMLFWTAPKAKTVMDEAVTYVVYRFDKGQKVDLDDPSRILMLTRDNHLLLPYQDGTTRYTYVVTSLDRLQNESKAAKKKVRL